MSLQATPKRIYTGKLAAPARVFEWIVDALANFANILMAFIVVLITAEIILRYFFNTGVIWAGEVTEEVMLWMTFLAAAWVLRKEGHVIVDLIPSRIGPRNRALLYAVLSALGILVCFVYTWYGTTTTIDLFQRQRALSTLLRPQAWILYVIIPVGSLMLTIQFFRRTKKYIQEYQGLAKPASGPGS